MNNTNLTTTTTTTTANNEQRSQSESPTNNNNSNGNPQQSTNPINPTPSFKSIVLPRRLSYVIPLLQADSSSLSSSSSSLSEYHSRPKPSILRVPTENQARDPSRSLDPRPLIIPISSSSQDDQEPHHQPRTNNTTSPRKNGNSIQSPQTDHHPRHCLGINALALDFSTAIQNRSGPEGILYSGGKDGLIAAWELGIKTQLRSTSSPFEDDHQDDEDEDDLEEDHHHSYYTPLSSALPTAPTEISRTDIEEPRPEIDPTLPSHKLKPQRLRYEERFEIDRSTLLQNPPPPTTLRQCVQSHTDWCNDIVLCNYNQTLISASSDRTLKAWSPHSPELALCPINIGSHSDYVKCLAYSSDRGWVASGGLDRKIKLWDIDESRLAPLATFTEDSMTSSIYSLATIPTGTILAAGSPSRTVGLYDPRLSTQIAKLVGHSDNVRAILLSHDGRHLLSASSDTTVKLWEIGMRRCLYTFAHHSASVWALSSQHPRLEVFHSGDRAGFVCKLDLEGCGDFAEGECVALCKVNEDNQIPDGSSMGNESVIKIAGADDTYLWTATGSSTIQRWRDVSTRSQRRRTTSSKPLDLPNLSPNPPPPSLSNALPSFSVSSSAEAARLEPVTQNIENRSKSSPSSSISPAVSKPFQPPGSGDKSGPTPITNQYNRSGRYNDQKDGIPLDALVTLMSPHDPISRNFGSKLTSQDPESTADVPVASSAKPDFLGLDALPVLSPIRLESISNVSHPSAVSLPSPPHITHAWQSYQMRDSCAEATPLRNSADSIIAGRSGLIRSELLNDRRHAITVDTTGQVALWDIIAGVCKGIYETSDPSSFGFDANQLETLGGKVSPTDLLKSIKERVEGQASIGTWCSVETQTGLLTVHLEEYRCFDAEAYADELDLPASVLDQMKDDHRLSLGKWVIRNLFDGYLSHHMRLRAALGSSKSSADLNPSSHFETPSGSAPQSMPTSSRVSFDNIPTPGVTEKPSQRRGSVTRTPGMTISVATPASTPIIPPKLRPRTNDTGTLNGIPTPLIGADSRSHSCDYFTLPRLTERSEEEEKSLVPQQQESEPGSSQASLPNRNSLEANRNDDSNPAGTPINVHPSLHVSTAGAIFTRFRALGKGPRRRQGLENHPPPVISDPMPLIGDARKLGELSQEALREKLKVQEQMVKETMNRPFQPCGSLEAPHLDLPGNIAILISEEGVDSGAWEVTYRGLVSTTEEDAETLEYVVPSWLLDFLWSNRTVIKEGSINKVTFLLEPEGGRQFAGLDELPNGNARLTASKILRMKKVISYVIQKLELDVKKDENPFKTNQKQENDENHTNNNSNNHNDINSSTKNNNDNHQEKRVEKKLEDEIELICNGINIPLKISLGAVKQWIWCKGGDVIIGYRWKKT